MKRMGDTITVEEEFRITLSPELCARLQVGPGDTVDMDVRGGRSCDRLRRNAASEVGNRFRLTRGQAVAA